MAKLTFCSADQGKLQKVLKMRSKMVLYKFYKFDV